MSFHGHDGSLEEETFQVSHGFSRGRFLGASHISCKLLRELFELSLNQAKQCYAYFKAGKLSS